ncbi:hypothetical protein Tco_0799695 [Tanacetum coccineum]|uniref:Uncharacterized protein n=1 Tax=Tanacetum coccineum TaxID=301880 RepID=A0ABQ4ZUW9_9ASTR
MRECKAFVIEEFANDALDSALDSDDMEDEIDEEVDRVLTTIAGDTAPQLSKAVRKERLKQPAQIDVYRILKKVVNRVNTSNGHDIKGISSRHLGALGTTTSTLRCILLLL